MTQINLSFPQTGGFTLSTVGVQGPSTGGGASSWNDLTDKPTEFPPEDHTHAISDVLLLQAALDGKADDAHTHAIADVTGLQTALDGKQGDLGFTPENVAQKGVAGGYAGLDGTGRVPAGQLPSFVDDVIEVANFAALPGTGEAGKIYITADDNAQFRWSGSAYVQITSSPGSTDAVPEGSTNLYFTEPRVRGTVLTGYAAAGSRTALAAADSILGAFNKIGKWLGDLAAVAFSGSASDLMSGTLPAARFDDTAHGNRAGGALHPDATTSVAGFMSGADKTKLDAITGTNTGDQTSIVGITGTKAQFDAAVTDGSIMYVGDAPTAHTHTTTDITGFAEAVDDRVAALIVGGTNMTVTYDDVAGTLTFDASGGGAGTDLSYNAATRLLSSSTGDDVTLPLAGANPGLMSAADKTTVEGVPLIDLKAQLWVLDLLSDPPVGPTAGDRYIVGASATGAWTGQEDDIATWTGSAWDFTTPELYWRAFNEAGGASFIYFGPANWAPEPSYVEESSISNSMLAAVETGRIKGRVSAFTGEVEDLTATQVRTLLNVANGANNYVHPNHTGDVGSTGDGVTALQPAAITGKTTVTADPADFVLISDTSDSGNLKKVLVSDLAGGGGGGATGGSAVLDFGPAPGSSVAEVTVTGQTGILVGSRPRAWVQGSTADHNEYEHSRILPGRVGVGVADIVAGVGFTICAVTEMRLTGLVAVKWEWQ